MEIIRTAASLGGILHLELDPLPAAAVGELLASLAIPGLEALGDDIVRYAGGSPMYILETVKHLVETDGVARRQATGIPLGGRVGAVVASRLERLSSAALELARLLAVLGTEFSLDRAATALEVAPIDLVPAWEELVAAQMVRGEAFAHDLLGEAVLAGMPEPVRRLLHRRAAEALDRDAGESARIAIHWQDAGEHARASARRRKAILASRHTLLEHDARRYFGE